MGRLISQFKRRPVYHLSLFFWMAVLGNFLPGAFCFAQTDSDIFLIPPPVAEVPSESYVPGGTDWLNNVRVGYDEGFVIADVQDSELSVDEYPFQMKINGWGQLRLTNFESRATAQSRNQFGLKRARLSFEGSAFTPDFNYYIQLDGRSSSGDDVRLLDFLMIYDLGRHAFGLEPGTLGFKTGKYKMPFTMSRMLTGKELEFSDRSMASMFFDVNRSLAWGLYGQTCRWRVPINWEASTFNGFVTGGAETGSSGALDNNFAFAARIHTYPTGNWGLGELADFDCHQTIATRFGAAYAASTMSRNGATEFNSLRVVDSGETLGSLLEPLRITEYDVATYAIDASCKYRGGSATFEYYFRNVNGFKGQNSLPDLFDHGFWFQMGKFVVPRKLEMLFRWSHVAGNSGTLGADNQYADEVGGGLVWYFRDQHAKATIDGTYLDGAPIDSSSLDIKPGDHGWLMRTQIQFAF